MGDIPAWKKAILDKKKQKDIDVEKKRKVEEEKLSQLPAWKRSLLLRKQEQDTTASKSSPPLSRAGFATKRKDSLLREHGTSETGNRGRSDSSSSLDQTAPTPTTTTATSPKVAQSPLSPRVKSAQPTPAPSQTHSDDVPVKQRGGSVSSDDGTAAAATSGPNVRQLMGMFKSKPKDEVSDSPTPAAAGAAPKRPGSAERRHGQLAGTSSAFRLSNDDPHSIKEPSTPTRPSTLQSPTASRDEADSARTQSNSADVAGEEDDEVTNIDDIVVDAKAMERFKISPARVAGVESLPTSPTFNASTSKRRGSCMAVSSTKRPMAPRRSVSFNELNIATVITFEREPSSGDEEEEEEAQEVPDRGPRQSTGLKSVPSIGGKKDGDQASGFQAFKPKAITETATEEIAMPSWRQQAPTPAKKKEEPEAVVEQGNMAVVGDLKVEDMEDEPALLW